MKKRLLFLTGNPGVGKTIILLKVVESLKAKGYSVGGMVSREVRFGGMRAGFEILDLADGKRGWLAHVNQPSGPHVGRYRVNMEDLDSVGAEAIVKAVENFDVVVIDEIGPMELFSEKFRDVVKKAVESGKLVVGVAHWKAKDKLIYTVKAREDAEIISVTYENRDRLHENLIEKAVKFLESRNKKNNKLGVRNSR